MKRILFVCLGNSCRSQMAEGFTRKLAPEVLDASSAGLLPASSVADETVIVMDERGIDIRSHRPKLYDPSHARDYDLIVNLSGFELPGAAEMDSGDELTPVFLEWPVEDPISRPLEVHRRIRDEVETRVRGLTRDIRERRSVHSHLTVGQRIAPDSMRKPGLWQRFTRWL